MAQILDYIEFKSCQDDIDLWIRPAFKDYVKKYDENIFWYMLMTYLMYPQMH